MTEKKGSVAINFPPSGLRRRVSRSAFEGQYKAEGWELVAGAAGTANTPEPEPEPEPTTPPKKPAKKAGSKKPRK